MVKLTNIRERVHQPFYDRLMTAKERKDAEIRHYFAERPVLQFTVDKSWKPCDVCGEDTRCRVDQGRDGKSLPTPLIRHMRCHRQLQAGIREDRGAVLAVVGEDYIFRKPNRHDRNRMHPYTDEQKERHLHSFKRQYNLYRYEPLQYLNKFDGIKMVQFYLDGINTRDVF